MIRIEGIAHGGAGIGRRGGKAVFVEGAFPGDVVDVEIVESARRYDRGRVTSLLEPSPQRVSPRCPHVATCGGCPWQGADIAAQMAWKGEIVAGQLRHVGGIEAPVEPVRSVGPAYEYRNRIDPAALDGRPAFHARTSSELVAVGTCHLAAPPLRSVVERLGDVGGLGAVGRLTLRVGVRTGEAVAVVDRVPAVDWGLAVATVGDARIHEDVAGVRFRISGRAFFQVNTWGADALVELVAGAADIGPTDVVLDGYAGGGLFSATVGRSARRVIAVESDPVARRDLVANTGGAVDVVPGPMERPLPGSRWDVAVVDPPRAGMGRKGVATVVSGSPRTIVSVSCDPATFARDARLLVEAGYRLERVWPLDLFPHTAHVETVARFTRP